MSDRFDDGTPTHKLGGGQRALAQARARKRGLPTNHPDSPARHARQTPGDSARHRESRQQPLEELEDWDADCDDAHATLATDAPHTPEVGYAALH